MATRTENRCFRAFEIECPVSRYSRSNRGCSQLYLGRRSDVERVRLEWVRSSRPTMQNVLHNQLQDGQSIEWPDGLLRIGREGLVLYANKASEELMIDGGWNRNGFAAPPLRDPAASALESGRLCEFEIACQDQRVMARRGEWSRCCAT